MVTRDLQNNLTRSMVARRQEDDRMLRRECVVRVSWNPNDVTGGESGDDDSDNEMTRIEVEGKEKEKEKEGKGNETLNEVFPDAVRYFPCVLLDDMNIIPISSSSSSSSSTTTTTTTTRNHQYDEDKQQDKEGEEAQKQSSGRVRRQILLDGWMCEHDSESFVLSHDCSHVEMNYEDNVGISSIHRVILLHHHLLLLLLHYFNLIL